MDKEIVIAIIGGGATIIAAVVGAVIAGRRSAARHAHSSTRDDFLSADGPRTAQKAQDRAAENRERVRDALHRLMQRTNDDAFLVIEEPSSSKFVQFVGDAHGVIVDMPLVNLTPAELQRAEALFAARPGLQRAKDSNGIESLQLDFAADVQLATQFTFDIFAQVYQLSPGYTVSLAEN